MALGGRDRWVVGERVAGELGHPDQAVAGSFDEASRRVSGVMAVADESLLVTGEAGSSGGRWCRPC
jgi:hypothetical protein